MFNLLLPAAAYGVADMADDKKLNASIAKRKNFMRNLLINFAGNKDILKLIAKLVKIEDGDTKDMLVKTIGIAVSITGLWLIIKDEDKFEGDNLMANAAAIGTNIFNILTLL